jgi:hypothetical protein
MDSVYKFKVAIFVIQETATHNPSFYNLEPLGSWSSSWKGRGITFSFVTFFLVRNPPWFYGQDFKKGAVGQKPSNHADCFFH